MYTSASLALAVLEVLVHLERPDLPGDLVAIPADIPDRITIARVAVSDLPPNWRRYPAPAALADLGMRWAHRGGAPVLAVPSAVIPQEPIYLLDPLHPDFRRIRVGKPEALRFDPRLRRR